MTNEQLKRKLEKAEKPELSLLKKIKAVKDNEIL